MTAPVKVQGLSLNLEGKNLLAKWGKVKHAKKYHITLYKEEEEVETATCQKMEYTFEESVDNGFSYYCQIHPENESGSGPIAQSNIQLARKIFCFYFVGE